MENGTQMSELDTLNAMLSGESPVITPTEPAPATTPEPETATPPPETTPETTPPEPTTETTPEPETPEQIFNSPRNQAFAQLRVQNTQMLTTLSRLGALLGLDKNTEADALIAAVQERLMATEAQAQQVPLQVYQELEQARKEKLENQQEMHRQQAALGFQNVKAAFQLSDADLHTFAQQLHDAGKNPFLQPLDLVNEYRVLNFDKILKAERDKAAQEALALQRKAERQSTTPSTATGKPEQAPTRIDSVAGLEALLGSRT